MVEALIILALAAYSGWVIVKKIKAIKAGGCGCGCSGCQGCRGCSDKKEVQDKTSPFNF